MNLARKTQAERRSIAERSILDAAIQVIAAHGISGTSFSQIGTIAGYSRGIATHYFGTKENLLVRVLDDVAAKFSDALETTDFLDADGLSQLSRLIELLLRRTKTNPKLARALQIMRAESLIAAPPLRDAIEDANRSSTRVVRDMLRSARESGHVRPDADIDVYSVLVIGALRGLVGQYLADPETVDIEPSPSSLELSRGPSGIKFPGGDRNCLQPP